MPIARGLTIFLMGLGFLLFGIWQVEAQRLDPNAPAVEGESGRLIDQLMHAGTARQAFDRLSSLGSKALPSIRTMFGHKQLRLVRAALDLTDRLGQEAAGTVKDLIAIVRNPRLGALRIRAVRILGRWGGSAAEVLPQLWDSLREPNRRLRQAVAETVVDLLTRSLSLPPETQAALASGTFPLRPLLVGAAVNLGPLVHPALPLVVNYLQKRPMNPVQALGIVLPGLLPGLGKLAPVAHHLLQPPTATATGEPLRPDSPAQEEEADQAEAAASFEDVPAIDTPDTPASLAASLTASPTP